MSEIEPSAPDTNRRDFLKKSLAAGAVVWSAPVVTSLPGGRAWAAQYRDCTCTGDAFGLRVKIPLLSIDQTFGVDGCVANVSVGNATVAAVTASAVCASDASSVNGGCSGLAQIASLDVRAGSAALPTLTVSATILEATASSLCEPPCSTTGNSTIARLTIGGTLVPGGLQVIATSGCNNDILNLGLIVFNEQTCDGNLLNVNALHITVPGVIEVIASHAEAGVDVPACPCPACGP
jgi:hypothetical protein